MITVVEAQADTAAGCPGWLAQHAGYTSLIGGLSQTGASMMTLSLLSDAFEDGGAIPREYTCEGTDTSPPLTWSGVPVEARSLVLIVDDPDAPDPEAPKMTWVHWVLYNLPPDTSGLAGGMTAALLPAGTREGLNDWQRSGYGGPCPPIGRHHYFHKLYALATILPDMGQATKAQVEAAMDGHVIAAVQLVGTCRKSSPR